MAKLPFDSYVFGRFSLATLCQCFTDINYQLSQPERDFILQELLTSGEIVDSVDIVDHGQGKIDLAVFNHKIKHEIRPYYIHRSPKHELIMECEDYVLAQKVYIKLGEDGDFLKILLKFGYCFTDKLPS